jgi:hypothetical protein
MSGEAVAGAVMVTDEASAGAAAASAAMTTVPMNRGIRGILKTGVLRVQVMDMCGAPPRTAGLIVSFNTTVQRSIRYPRKLL